MKKKIFFDWKHILNSKLDMVGLFLIFFIMIFSFLFISFYYFFSSDGIIIAFFVIIFQLWDFKKIIIFRINYFSIFL